MLTTLQIRSTPMHTAQASAEIVRDLLLVCDYVHPVRRTTFSAIRSATRQPKSVISGSYRTWSRHSKLDQAAGSFVSAI
jgi:hypothetical protein